MSGLAWLKKKYPALQFFNVEEGVGAEDLAVLAGEGEGEVEARAKSAEGKRVMKRVRQFASYAESKLKNGRKLYKFLAQQQGLLTQIILNNQKIKAIDALQNRRFEHLTELQLSNNEISQLDPLTTLSAPYLEELDLSSNAIQFIKQLNPCRWNSLTALLLSQNRILSIQGVRFGQFTSLRQINLSENFLTRIRYLRKQVNELNSLKKIDLLGNSIIDLHTLSECRFLHLEYLDLRNNNLNAMFAIEKINMGTRQTSFFKYEIKVTTGRARDKHFIYGYREISRHKLAAKLQAGCQLAKRETVQKGRRLIFD